jgi:DNA repair protein RecN (Recombination protein N)
MLKQLEISNYALIRHTAVSFEAGFTVITGETGAGKSILLEALGLVLGSRANFNAIRRGEEKCVIEATFAYANEALKTYLQKEGLDVLSDLILRRELTASGRSRAFVNDSPVNITVLRDVAAFLVDLHGQQENLSLQTPAYQVRQLDLFARNQQTLAQYTEAYKSFKSTEKQLQQLREAAAQVRKDEDYFKFQYDELVDLKLDEEHFAGLDDELNTLEHAEEIQRALGAADGMLDGEEGTALSLLRKIRSELRSVERYSEPIREALERLDSSMIELEDLRSECARLASSIEWNPSRVDQVREEMDRLQHVLHKHGATDVKALAEIREEYRIKLDGIASYDDEMAQLETKFAQQERALQEAAKALTTTRETARDIYIRRLTEQVRKLGMPKAEIEVKLLPLQQFSSTGAETVEMAFDANGGKHLVSLKDSASGGEVSRLMLALKSILAENDQTPTLIFDEIDTGVSGEIAKQIGVLMQQISAYTQIIAVTHLPGVAAKGMHHYRIAKREDDGQVISELHALHAEERVEEIATMFSGKDLSEASRESARNLLEGN